MQKKVKCAVFGSDQVAEIAEYELSKNGDKIKIVESGEGYFMPSINKTSFLDMPIKFLGRTIGRERIYFARKKAKECVNFETGALGLPDEELIKQAIAAAMLDKVGTPQKPPMPAFLFYIMLLVNVGIALKVFGVIS